MPTLLRGTYYLASAASLFLGLATTVSMFIAERAPQAAQYRAVTIAVSLFFALAGLLLLGIARELAAMGVLARSMAGDHSAALRARWNRLAAYMLLGGMVLLAILLPASYAIIARIGQGLAAFG